MLISPTVKVEGFVLSNIICELLVVFIIVSLSFPAESVKIISKLISPSISESECK